MRKIIAVLFALSLACLLAGCCSHEWVDATCLEPRTCSECGETDGEALGHSWQEAACEAPKTCSACAQTEGEALGHSWEEATCLAPKTCSLCLLTEGDALEHRWNRATCTEETICSLCNTASGEFGPHMDIETISREGESDVRLLCRCGEEEVVSAQALMLRLMQGSWTLRLIQDDNGVYRPDPGMPTLEFPSATDPMGYEAGSSPLVEYVVPFELVEFAQSNVMFNDGPIPVLTCNALSEYEGAAYLKTPIILFLGDRNYAPTDDYGTDFYNAAARGELLSLWRINVDGYYIYSYTSQ